MSNVKIKGSIRKDILKQLPPGSMVFVIGKIKRGTYACGLKVNDLNCKKMTVAFGEVVLDVCYFNLSCHSIEQIIRVTSFMKGEDPDALPF